MDEILAGLQLVLQPLAIFYLIVGVVAGFVVGVLPGFSTPNAAAVLLPFTLVLPIEVSLIFIAGIYAGTNFAAAVPAILLNVPGTGSSAATALDGYPLAQQGKAQMAIGIARMASMVGGVIGAVICIALLQPMASFALQFGSVEMFLLTVLGLSMIATLVGDKGVSKGLIAALLGVAVSAMAADSMHGVGRFTMGIPQLYDQVPFVPALIGLFGIAQMFELARKRRLPTLPPTGAPTQGNRFIDGVRSMLVEFTAGMRATLAKPLTLIRSSLIGVGIGIAPGAGTAVSTFVAYGEARRSSKHPEEFGHGSHEGIIAAESSDNATTAGTLVPTLALGIPGGSTAAVMLTALYMSGVVPGPHLMTQYAPQAYAVLIGLLFASVLILPLGVLLATPMTYVTRVKPGMLVPVVLVVALIGAYAVRLTVFDAMLALVFGIVGLLMRIGGYPVVPMVLGLILGPLAEANFVRALRLGNYDPMYFFSLDRPIAVGLWALLALMVLFNLLRARNRRSEKKADSGAVA